MTEGGKMKSKQKRRRAARKPAFVLGKSTPGQMLRYLGLTSHVVHDLGVTKYNHGELNITCSLWPRPKAEARGRRSGA